MRITNDKRDKAYDPLKVAQIMTASVWLDGQKLDNCITADDILHEVIVEEPCLTQFASLKFTRKAWLKLISLACIQLLVLTADDSPSKYDHIPAQWFWNPQGKKLNERQRNSVPKERRS